MRYRWPWQDQDKDGKPDDYPFDTYNEIFLAWIAVCLTVLAVGTILYYIFGG